MSSVVLPGQNNDHHCYLSYYCAIEDDDSVVLTGGRESRSQVTKYNVEGWRIPLPFLNTGRRYHACGTFTTADMETERLGFIYYYNY